MMSLDEIGQAIETAHAASFLDEAQPTVDGSTGDRSSMDNHAPIALEIEV